MTLPSLSTATLPLSCSTRAKLGYLMMLEPVFFKAHCFYALELIVPAELVLPSPNVLDNKVLFTN